MHVFFVRGDGGSRGVKSAIARIATSVHTCRMCNVFSCLGECVKCECENVKMMKKKEKKKLK